MKSGNVAMRKIKLSSAYRGLESKMGYKFQTEEEVKEYLHNLGIQYRYGCFTEKNVEACHLLGEYLEIIKEEHVQAAKIFEANCNEHNFPRSCDFIGSFRLRGIGNVKQDIAAAFRDFKKACNADITNSCYRAGVILLSSTRQPGEGGYEKGLKLLDKACLLNSIYACQLLTKIYLRGCKFAEKDLSKGFEYCERACKLGSSKACRTVRDMYKNGKGVEKNEEKAKLYDQMADQLEVELEVHDLGQNKDWKRFFNIFS